MAAKGCSRLDTSIKRQSKQDSAFLIPKSCPFFQEFAVFCTQFAAESSFPGHICLSSLMLYALKSFINPFLGHYIPNICKLCTCKRQIMDKNLDRPLFMHSFIFLYTSVGKHRHAYHLICPGIFLQISPAAFSCIIKADLFRLQIVPASVFQQDLIRPGLLQNPL